MANKRGDQRGAGSTPKQAVPAKTEHKAPASFDPRPVSMNPPPNAYLGTPGRDNFMESLAWVCASAFLQTCSVHPLHPAYMAGARRNRRQINPRGFETAEVNTRIQ